MAPRHGLVAVGAGILALALVQATPAQPAKPQYGAWGYDLSDYALAIRSQGYEMPRCDRLARHFSRE